MTNRIKITITGDASGYTTAAGAAARQTEQLEQRAGGLGAQLGNVRTVAAAAAAVMGGVVVTSAAAAAKAIYEASAASQRLQTTLNFATGGRGVGELAYLRKITAELGLEFQSTAVAYARFQAAARGTALEGQKAREVFESVAKASAVMGLSADETSGVLLALQQMVSKGTVQAEELRGQLGERLPGAFQIAARAMGVTTAELGKMLEQGQVVADDFLPKFAKALDESLGDAAEKAANRLDASVNKFNNAWERLKKTAGDSGVSSAMNSELGKVTRFVDAVSDAMASASEKGNGALVSLGSGAGVAAARSGLGALALVANSLNGSINFLSGGLVELRTDLSLVPDALKSNQERFASLKSELENAEQQLAKLQARGDAQSGNIYIRSAYAEAVQYVEKLREAIAEQSKLAGDPRDAYNNFPSRSRSYADDAARRDAEKTRRMEALSAVTARLSGVNENYLKSLQAIQVARDAGDISEARSIELLQQLAKDNFKVERATKGAKTEAQSFVEQLKRQVEELEAQAATFGLGETALVRYKAAQLGLSKEVDAYIKRMEAANRELAKQAAAEMQARDAAAWRAEQFQKTKDRSEQIKDLEREIDAIGRSEVALHALEQARLLDNAAALEAQAIRNRDRGYDDQAAALQKEADDLRKLAALREQAFFKRTTEDSRQAMRELRARDMDEWDQHLDRVSQSFTDALFDGGKSGLDLIKGYARSSIIQMPAELVLKPIAGAARQLLNPGAVGSGSVGSGLLGNAATSLLGSSWGGSLASGAFGGGLTGLVGSGLSSLGSALGWSSLSGFGAGLTGAGTLAGSTALSMGASGAAAGAAVSAAIPYIGLAVAIASMLGDRNKWSGQFGEASVSNYVAAAGGSSTFTNSKLSTDMAKGTASLAQSISDLSRSYGGVGDFTLRQFSATASKKDRAQAGTDLYVNGQYFTTGSTEVKKDQQAQAFADQALRATVKVLQETVAGRFGEYFDSVDALAADIPELQALIDNAQAVRAIGEQFSWMGGELERLGDLSVTSTIKLAQAAGGYDSLASSARATYDIIYSEQERISFLAEDVTEAFRKVGQDVPATTEAYKAALERARTAVQNNVDGAEELYAVLLKMGPAWRQVTVDVQDAAASLIETVGRYTQAARAGVRPMQLDTTTEAQQKWEWAQANGMSPFAESTLRAWRRSQEMAEEARAAVIDPGRKAPATDGVGMAVVLPTADTVDDLADAARAAEDRLKSLTDLMRGERDEFVLGGMSELDRSLAAVAKQMRETTRTATELGATEEDLWVIRQNAVRRSSAIVAESAFDSLQRAIDAQKAAINTGLRDSIERALERMQLDVPARAAMDRRAAQAQLQTALAIQRAGGPVADAGALREAIDTVSQPGQDYFGSSVDYARDYYATRRSLAELAKESYEDKLLANSASMLQTAREQLDALQGIDRSILSVPEAMARFDKAFAEASAAYSASNSMIQHSEALQVDISAMREEIKGLRSDLASANAAIASYTNRTQRILDRWDTDGMPATSS